MPLFEYECDACGGRFEVIQKFSDTSVETCKHCGKGPVHRLVSSPAIQFKGTGWYVTDYAQKGKSDASSTNPSGKTTDAAKPDSGGSSGDSGGTPQSDTAPPPATPASGSAAAPATGGKSEASKASKE